MRSSDGYSQVGGLRIGRGLSALNATWPFAKLKVGTVGLEIMSDLGRYEFPKSSIRKHIIEAEFLLQKGLRIEHNVTDYPDFVVFWTFNHRQLARELERRGYTVTMQR
jgi:hypothetical protein